MSKDILEVLQSDDILIMPCGTGTELQRRGYSTTLPLWSASANLEGWDLLREIHADNFRAGADICVTNTFRTTTRTYKKTGGENRARESLKRAVAAAKDAQKAVPERRTYIAGSFATLEDCYSPHLVPSNTELQQEHGEQADWLAAEGVDYLLPETINSVREAKYMARAASDTGLPFMITFVVDANAKLLDGGDITEALEETDVPGRMAVGLNCRPVDVIDAALPKLMKVYDGTVGAYANGFGHPHDDLGWLFEENADSIERYARSAREWAARGVRIIGGCCGTTPAYIEALARTLR